uniref:Secreted protein n=1 Tax=Poecilia mexicana TaxID=48701 RepID=A0A3B3X8V2_9TELE
MWLYCLFRPFLFGSPRAPMTLPRARRPLLIWMLSFSLSPVLPVLKIRSDPAKSTKWNLEDNTCVFPRHLLEFGFIWVAPVCLAVFPDSSKLNTSSRPSTSLSFTPHNTGKQRDIKFTTYLETVSFSKIFLVWMETTSN